MQNDQDRDMVSAVRAGEPGAFDAIYLRFGGLAWSVAYHLMQDRDDADDMAADAWLKLYRALPSAQPDTNLAAFIAVAVRRWCIDELRHRQRIRMQPWDPAVHDGLLVSPYNRPEQDVIATETATEVRTALASVGRRHRALLLMAMDHQMSMAEMGDQLGMHRQAVKSASFRARQELRQVARDMSIAGVA